MPIKGIEEGSLEKCKNEINSLRPFLYPNVAFDIITNHLDGTFYLLFVVWRLNGGPFMVSEKAEKAKSLHLMDKNDPTEKKVKNFAVLMFANKAEDYIPYAYIELIIDFFGTKRKMESKYFKGPIWKQYYAVVNYNKLLPPLKLQDLNERTFFNERDTENPEIRDMFKSEDSSALQTLHFFLEQIK